jgi:hypothetical protein
MTEHFRVLRGERRVLRFDAAPGVLLGTAARAAGQAPVRHPFVNAQALDPRHEDRLAALLERATTVQEFIALLEGSGYVVEREEVR